MKETLIKKKIADNSITSDELENNLENQEMLFKYNCERHPTIAYYDITLQQN